MFVAVQQRLPLLFSSPTTLFYSHIPQIWNETRFHISNRGYTVSHVNSLRRAVFPVAAMTVEQQNSAAKGEVISSNNSSLLNGSTITVNNQQQQKLAQQKYKVIFVLGPPGSGKGTQCQRIQQCFGFAHLSAGDLLREERQRKGSQFGELIEQHIREGTIVPVQITCKLIENAMLARADTYSGFLVDGFPRNQDNLDGWQREMADKVDVLFVLMLSAPTDLCVQRCLNRGQGRTDDNENSMRKRIVTYNEHTLPIINHYRALKLVEEVDGSRPVDEVFQVVQNCFKKYGISESVSTI